MLELIIPVILLAFILEFFDASVGMGYGTMLIPALLLLDFDPLEAVPAILLTNVLFGLFAGGLHHRFKNVDFGSKSKDFHILAILVSLGIVGVVVAAFAAFNISDFILKVYIGLLILAIGAFNLIKHKKRHKFSWNKIKSLGFLAAFNKGISGGGYGPVVVGGQILSGVQSKKAVGIALLAEGLISIIGVIAYGFLENFNFNWVLITSLLIGALPAVPLAVFVVNKFHPRNLRRIISMLSIALGSAILSNLFL